MVIFLRVLSGRKSPWLSSALCRILADFKIALFFSQISSSFSLFLDLWANVPKTLTTTCITVSFMSHSFSSARPKSKNQFLLFYFLWLFHTSINRWSFTCVTPSPILFSRIIWVFSQILTMVCSEQSRFFLWFPIPPIFFQRLWRQLHGQQQQLVFLLLFCFIFFSSLARSIYFFYLFEIFYFRYLCVTTAKSIRWQLYFCQWPVGLVLSSEIVDPFVYKIPDNSMGPSNRFCFVYKPFDNVAKSLSLSQFFSWWPFLPSRS